MEISLLGLTGIGLATMFFGYFFGLFEGRGQGYKKRQSEEKPQDSHATPPVEVRARAARNLLELGRSESGETILQVDGRPVATANMAPEQRRRIIELMVMLRPWIEPSASPTKSDAPPAPAVDHASSASTGGGAPPSGSRQALPAASPPTPAPPAASMSLVAQIDSILQTRLAGTPLADRGIRLTEALHGGAIVFIGTSRYDGVDKVPDPEVQAAIRGAIAEWERRVGSA